MKNSIKKVGATFLGLSCLLGGVLTFTGCETQDDWLLNYNKTAMKNGPDYDSLAKEVEEQFKLTRTYNVDTVKLYKACMEMIRDYEGFGNYHNVELKVADSDKPSKAGESGYISLAECEVITTGSYSLGTVYDDDGKPMSSYAWGTVKYEPTLYIESGSSENTSVLTIKPRWGGVYHWSPSWNDDDLYRSEVRYYNSVFRRDFAKSILDGVQNCIR